MYFFVKKKLFCHWYMFDGWSYSFRREGTDILRQIDGYFPSYLDQMYFCDPVVLEWICYRARAKRLINEGNTTGRLRKIWTGRT